MAWRATALAGLWSGLRPPSGNGPGPDVTPHGDSPTVMERVILAVASGGVRVVGGRRLVVAAPPVTDGAVSD